MAPRIRSLLLIVVALVAVGAALTVPHGRRLDVESLGRPVPGTSGMRYVPDYRWTTAGIFLRETNDPVLDPSTGKMRYLSPALHRAYHRNPSIMAAVAGRVRLGRITMAQARTPRIWLPSPDGKWLLTSVSTRSGVDLVAARTDGNGLDATAIGPYTVSPTYLDWSSDSAGWIYIGDAGRSIALRHHELSVPNDLTVLTSAYTTAGPRDLRLLGPGQSSVLVLDPLDASASIAHVSTMRSDPATVDAASVPSGDEIQMAASSPAGDRIAWIVAAPKPWSFIDAVKRLWPSPPARDVPVAQVQQQVIAAPLLPTQIWVSRADGTGMHEAAAGTVDVRSYDDEIQNVSWTPDGKSIAFVYRRALWTVPAR